MLTFDKLHNDRKSFIKNNNSFDHVVINGKNNILLSAPHGVRQVRLGKLKGREIGSLATALYLQNQTNCFLIAKTRNNNDDANFDQDCEYRKSLSKLIKENDIKYLIDIHGLAAARDIDVNLGIHLGINIETDISAFEQLNDSLIKNGFSVSIDQPFMAGSRTISGSLKDEFRDLWTIQIEINCAITNKRENFERYKKLLDILQDWIKMFN